MDFGQKRLRCGHSCIRRRTDAERLQLYLSVITLRCAGHSGGSRPLAANLVPIASTMAIISVGSKVFSGANEKSVIAVVLKNTVCGLSSIASIAGIAKPSHKDGYTTTLAVRNRCVICESEIRLSLYYE